METQVIGSEAWLCSVFASPAARDIKGRSRPTQRFATTVDEVASYAEGGNTAVARNLLHTMRNGKVVTRFKLEPFELSEDGLETVPDIIFQTHDDKVYVVEVKSYRFLIEEKLEKCRAVEQKINASGMKYLLWTDRWPLNRYLWNLTRRLRMNGYADIRRTELDYAEKMVKAGATTMGRLAELGVYQHVVLAAVWHGRLHINLFEPLTNETRVTFNVTDRMFNPTLTASVLHQTFWHDMKKY